MGVDESGSRPEADLPAHDIEHAAGDPSWLDDLRGAMPPQPRFRRRDAHPEGRNGVFTAMELTGREADGRTTPGVCVYDDPRIDSADPQRRQSLERAAAACMDLAPTQMLLMRTRVHRPGRWEQVIRVGEWETVELG